MIHEAGSALRVQNLRRFGRRRRPVEVSVRTMHTTATLLLQDKPSPKVVSERLGHANVQITLDVYGHVLPGRQEEATERLDKLIFG